MEEKVNELLNMVTKLSVSVARLYEDVVDLSDRVDIILERSGGTNA